MLCRGDAVEHPPLNCERKKLFSRPLSSHHGTTRPFLSQFSQDQGIGASSIVQKRRATDLKARKFVKGPVREERINWGSVGGSVGRKSKHGTGCQKKMYASTEKYMGKQSTTRRRRWRWQRQQQQQQQQHYLLIKDLPFQVDERRLLSMLAVASQLPPSSQSQSGLLPMLRSRRRSSAFYILSRVMGIRLQMVVTKSICLQADQGCNNYWVDLTSWVIE